jgi:hypothetical protein
MCTPLSSKMAHTGSADQLTCSKQSISSCTLVIERKIKENLCRFLKRSQRPRKMTPTLSLAIIVVALTLTIFNFLRYGPSCRSGQIRGASPLNLYSPDVSWK